MKQQDKKQLDSVKDQIKRQAGIFPANKHQADPAMPPFRCPIPSSFNKNQADPVPFELQETSLLDPSIIYAVHLTNAAADAILRMRRVLEIVEPYKVCGYSEHLEELGCKVTSVVDELINFAAAYAKASL